MSDDCSPEDRESASILSSSVRNLLLADSFDDKGREGLLRPDFYPLGDSPQTDFWEITPLKSRSRQPDVTLASASVLHMYIRS